MEGRTYCKRHCVLVIVVISGDSDSDSCEGTYWVADGCHHHVLVVEMAGDAVVWGLTEWLMEIIVSGDDGSGRGDLLGDQCMSSCPGGGGSNKMMPSSMMVAHGKQDMQLLVVTVAVGGGQDLPQTSLCL